MKASHKIDLIVSVEIAEHSLSHIFSIFKKKNKYDEDVSLTNSTMKQNSDPAEPVSIRLLKLEHVIARCHIGRTEIYRRINKNTFPAPLKLGPRINVWPESVINKWIAYMVKKSVKKDV